MHTSNRTGRPEITRHSGGFTLVEVLIVVVLLGIIAMVAIPKIGMGSNDARESALRADLWAIRGQIALYRAEHDGAPGPHLDENGDLDWDNFVPRLTGRTDPDGTINPNGECGPYLYGWPTNPFFEPQDSQFADTVLFGEVSTPPRTNFTGWYYSKRTCIISANTTIGAEALDPPAE